MFASALLPSTFSSSPSSLRSSQLSISSQRWDSSERTKSTPSDESSHNRTISRWDFSEPSLSFFRNFDPHFPQSFHQRKALEDPTFLMSDMRPFTTKSNPPLHSISTRRSKTHSRQEGGASNFAPLEEKSASVYSESSRNSWPRLPIYFPGGPKYNIFAQGSKSTSNVSSSQSSLEHISLFSVHEQNIAYEMDRTAKLMPDVSTDIVPDLASSRLHQRQKRPISSVHRKETPNQLMRDN